MLSRRTIALATTVSGLLGFAAPAHAQSDEVVVTAQKRQENLQEVPIAITALSAEELDRSGLRSGMDLTTRVPGLYFGRSAAYAIPFLRGVGTNNVTAGDESSVAVYVDGVYQQSLVGNVLQFNNVERIEVLKGPQGTLFGRNATGGLVNIITRTPTQDFVLDAKAGYGNFDVFDGSLYLAGGISPRVAADLAVAVRDQGEPYVTNLVNRSKIGEDSSFAARSKIVFEASDALRVTATLDYADAVSTQNVVRNPAPGSIPLASLAGGLFSYGPDATYNSYNPTSDIEQWGASVRVDARFKAFDFVSTTAYRNTQYLNVLETDATSADGVFSVVHPVLGVQALPTLGFAAPLSEPAFWSQEFQLLSNDEGPLEWIVGLYGSTNEASYDGFAILAGQNIVAGSRTFSTLEATSLSAFAQGTYTTGPWSFTAGLRLNNDERRFTGFAGAVTTNVKKEWTEPTWRLAADYTVSDNLMFYASYSRGYKSGLYNVNTITARTPVNPEILDAYEVGFKSEIFSDRLRLNGSAFHYDYQDLQYQALAAGGGASILQNAAAATIDGAELEATAFIGERAKIFSGVSYLDAQYDEFPAAQVFVPAPPAGGRQIFLNVAGRQMIRAPEWTANVGGEVEIPSGAIGYFTLGATYFYSSSFPFEPNGRLFQDDYGYLNASATWTHPNEKVSVQLWANNAFDERYYTNMSPSGRGDTVAYAPGALYGIRFGYRR